MTEAFNNKNTAPMFAERPVPTVDQKHRTNVWTFVLYEKDAVDGWEEILSSDLAGAISPLHDQDRSRTEPEIMIDAHYHVILHFGSSGKKSFKQVKAIMDSVGGTGLEPVRYEPSIYRYLTHKGFDDKYQYDENGIILFGGYERPVDTQRQGCQLQAEILETIDEHGIRSFYSLNDYYRKKDDYEALAFIKRNAGYLNALINSRSKHVSPKAEMQAMDYVDKHIFQMNDALYQVNQRMKSIEDRLTPRDGCEFVLMDSETGEIMEFDA